MSRRRPTTFILLASVLSGVLLWLSWPEGGFTPLIFLAFVPLFFADYSFDNIYKRKKSWKMFGNFYIAFLIWNAATTWWIYNATDYGSFVAIGLNALFMTIVWQLYYLVKKRHGSAVGYTSLIFFWIAFEYLHLNWEISWPWLTLGNVFATRPGWVQWYEYTGVLGGTFWILMINILIFQLVKNLWYKDLLFRIRKINVFLLSTLIFILVATPLIYSLYVYYDHVDEGKPVKIVLLQPNIDPYNEKFRGNGEAQLSEMIRLAAGAIDYETEYCIAPETALPDGIYEDELESDPAVRNLRRFVLRYPSLNLLVGLTSFKNYREGEKISLTARKYGDSNTYYDVYNSALLITGIDAAQLYHKSKLVPGVEKMPYPKIFGFLEKYALQLGGTSGSLGTQSKRTNFVANDGTKIAPAICYESIYGDFMSAYMRDTAQFIAVMTNDGWWGNTPGYRQHMNYARLLAVEFRKSVIRSANTGISCFINQRGDVIEKSEWWKEAALKNTIMKNNNITFYAKYGDYIGFICSFLTVTMLVFLVVRRFLL